MPAAVHASQQPLARTSSAAARQAAAAARARGGEARGRRRRRCQGQLGCRHHPSPLRVPAVRVVDRLQGLPGRCGHGGRGSENGRHPACTVALPAGLPGPRQPLLDRLVALACWGCDGRSACDVSLAPLRKLHPLSAARRTQRASSNVQQRAGGPRQRGEPLAKLCSAGRRPRPSFGPKTDGWRCSRRPQPAQRPGAARGRRSTASGLPWRRRGAVAARHRPASPSGAPQAGWTPIASSAFPAAQPRTMNGVGGFGMAPPTGVAPVAPSNEQRVGAAGCRRRPTAGPRASFCCRRARCCAIAAVGQPAGPATDHDPHRLPACQPPPGAPPCCGIPASAALLNSAASHPALPPAAGPQAPADGRAGADPDAEGRGAAPDPGHRQAAEDGRHAHQGRRAAGRQQQAGAADGAAQPRRKGAACGLRCAVLRRSLVVCCCKLQQRIDAAAGRSGHSTAGGDTCGICCGAGWSAVVLEYAGIASNTRHCPQHQQKRQQQQHR